MSLDKVEGGFAITAIKLDSAVKLPGIPTEKFDELIKRPKKAVRYRKCLMLKSPSSTNSTTNRLLIMLLQTTERSVVFITLHAIRLIIADKTPWVIRLRVLNAVVATK